MTSSYNITNQYDLNDWLRDMCVKYKWTIKDGPKTSVDDKGHAYVSLDICGPRIDALPSRYVSLFFTDLNFGEVLEKMLLDYLAGRSYITQRIPMEFRTLHSYNGDPLKGAALEDYRVSIRWRITAYKEENGDE